MSATTNLADKGRLKRQVAAWIDQHVDEQIAFLTALVQCPSDNPPGNCAPHASLAMALLEEMKFKVEQHAVPADTARQHGMQTATNLIVRERFAAGPTVALNAHGDVVPSGNGWSADPYGASIRDGWMIGRGAAVSKSDFATYAFALRALKTVAAPLRGSVELHFTYDEETGGLVGPGWLLEQGLTRPDYAICAAFSYHVTTAHNGCLHLQVTVRGKSAHAARPDTGYDAIEAAATLLNALYRYRDTLKGRHSGIPGIESPTLIVGTIQGGINTNVVADVVTLRIDRRIIPEEIPESVEAELLAVVDHALQGLPGISCAVKRVLLARPLKPVGDAARLADIICAEAGVPTVMYGAGPHSLLEANGHRADERVPLAMLPIATKAVAWSLIELL